MSGEAWRARLTELVHVGDGQYKQLKDCTVEDFKAAAREKYAEADRLAASAARDFEAAAALKKRDGGDSVAG